MAKVSRKRQKNTENENNNDIDKIGGTKAVAKRTRKSVPRESPQQRSSVHRGVTRHRWTGRYEAHLWDKNCWNDSQNKKGRQVYLGAYDNEEAAAHAYDLAALKYWGQDTILNFPLSTYIEELKEMECQSKEEYIGSLRRKSSGFSRGVSKYRGVARHHHNGRWEARIGRVFGNKYLYLGTYATQEEAATAYDVAAIEYRGLNAVTNFDLSRYINLLRPNGNNHPSPISDVTTAPSTPNLEIGFVSSESAPTAHDRNMGSVSSAPSALGLLLQSSKFKEMLELNAGSDSSSSSSLLPSTSLEADPPRGRSFPEHIQTYFDCQDYSAEGHDILFGDLGHTFEGSAIEFECGQVLDS